jgi:signal transduction histidine kinase
MANKKILHDMMLSTQEVIGASCYDVLHRSCETVTDCRSEQSADHVCPWNKIRENNRPVVMTHIHRDEEGEPRHLEISASPVFGSEGNIEYIIESLVDVTDKIRMEEMKRTEEKLTGIVEMASAVSHELNTPMFTVLGNAQLLRRIVKPEDPAQEEVEAIIRNVKRMSQLTKKMARITEYATKDYVDGEKLVDIIAASNTAEKDWAELQKERIEREERWLNLERLAAMGVLTGSVAHELNNAINIVLGYSQLLLREASEETTTWADLKKIEKNAKQCQRIVSGLLDYTRAMSGERRYRDVNEHLEGVLSLVEHRMSLEGIKIIRRFAPRLKAVMMDEDEMKQVYLNLLNNAADAIGRNGEILVETELDRTRNQVIVSFSDTGPGIPQEIMDQIFSPFFSTKARGSGTGLGLNVSLDIVRKHGGFLEAMNRPQGGAVFRIRLPVHVENG